MNLKRSCPNQVRYWKSSQKLRWSHIWKTISEAQFGFRKGRLTVTAVAKLVCEVVDGIDHDTSTNSLFDLYKTFNCVSIDALLYKIE